MLPPKTTATALVPSADEATENQACEVPRCVHVTPAIGTQVPVVSPSWSVGQVPVPDMATAALPPGVAEKATRAEASPAVLGAKTTRTAQDALAARTVVPDTQSPAIPVWTAKSVLFDVTVMAPLVCWPLFLMLKVATLLD